MLRCQPVFLLKTRPKGIENLAQSSGCSGCRVVKLSDANCMVLSKRFLYLFQ